MEQTLENKKLEITFRNTDEAIRALFLFDKPDEFEAFAGGFIIHYGEDEFRYESKTELKNWIIEQIGQQADFYAKIKPTLDKEYAEKRQAIKQWLAQKYKPRQEDFEHSKTCHLNEIDCPRCRWVRNKNPEYVPNWAK